MWCDMSPGYPDLVDTPESRLVRYSDKMSLQLKRIHEMNADLRSCKVVVENRLTGRCSKQSRFYLFF